MKKLSVRLSLLCMLAVLLIPFAGCKKEDTVEETPAMSTDAAIETTTTEPTPVSTDLGTDTMGTDTMGTDTMGTDAPPAGQ